MSTCTEVQSLQYPATPAAPSANRYRLIQLSAAMHAEGNAPFISSMPAGAREQGRAEIFMQSSMQPEVHPWSATAAGTQHAQRHDSRARAAIKALPEAGSRPVSLDMSVVAATCSIFQDASILIGMHPDQVGCKLYVNADPSRLGVVSAFLLPCGACTNNWLLAPVEVYLAGKHVLLLRACILPVR